MVAIPEAVRVMDVPHTVQALTASATSTPPAGIPFLIDHPPSLRA
jgi:hypothetical protein